MICEGGKETHICEGGKETHVCAKDGIKSMARWFVVGDRLIWSTLCRGMMCEGGKETHICAKCSIKFMTR